MTFSILDRAWLGINLKKTMHEFNLTEKLLAMSLESAKGRRIVNVNLLIGPFSADREESIRFYWRDLAKGTPGDGASLCFEHAQPEIKCLGCGGALDIEHEGSICVYCQNHHSDLLSGPEVRLQSIELE
jgi:Zn finger protein HypA/HybF involved in hydrogenase expression